MHADEDDHEDGAGSQGSGSFYSDGSGELDGSPVQVLQDDAYLSQLDGQGARGGEAAAAALQQAIEPALGEADLGACHALVALVAGHELRLDDVPQPFVFGV